MAAKRFLSVLLVPTLILTALAGCREDTADGASGTESVYYTVSTQAEDLYGTAGSYTKLDQKQIALGESVTLTATPSSGYSFEGWYLIDGTGLFATRMLASEAPVYTFTMTEKQNDTVFYEAVFSYYTVSTESYTDEYGVAGTYDVMNEKKVSVGETVTLTATVNDGYNFDGWFRGDVCLSQDFTYTFIMPSESLEIRAVYSCYEVSTYSYYNQNHGGAAGTYTKLDRKKVSAGKTVTITASANPGYRFTGWYFYFGVDATCVCSSPTYTFVMERESVNLCAGFEAIDS